MPMNTCYIQLTEIDKIILKSYYMFVTQLGSYLG